MSLSKLVQDVGCIESGVVAQLSRNHFERLRHATDEQLLLTSNGTRVVPQVLAQLHLNCSTTCAVKSGFES